MFHQSSLPSLEEAIAAMAQEETRLNVMKANASAPPRPAYVVTGTQETRICYNCGDKGHLSCDCHQPFKFNRGRGRSSARGALRGGGSRGGRRGYRANLAAIEEAAIEEMRSHCGSRGMASEFVTIPVAELEELRKQKRNEEGSRSNDQRQTPSIDSSGTLDQAFTSIQNYNSDWILDSGASRHVTGMSSEFASFTPYPDAHKETIQIADGTYRSIKGVGTVRCTPSLHPLHYHQYYMFLLFRSILFQ